MTNCLFNQGLCYMQNSQNYSIFVNFAIKIRFFFDKTKKSGFVIFLAIFGMLNQIDVPFSLVFVPYS